MEQTKNIIQIITNKDNKYPGNLEHCFRVVWQATNVMLPYHNMRHMLHVMWNTYNGAMFYKIGGRTLRNMLIAALFHDFGHTGNTVDDSINIAIAIAGLEHNLLPEDVPYRSEITSYIKATEMPSSTIDNAEENLPKLILRDADLSYTLEDVWIQPVNFGLNFEMGISTEKILKFQETFLTKILVLSTDWAKQKYSQKIKDRVEEANEMIKVLYP
jgi:HD superfamily phosphodiesterase